MSHDRYLLERVTDQQYAILDGRLRAPAGRRGGVPGAAVLRRGCPAAAGREQPRDSRRLATADACRWRLRRARDAEKELAAINRRLAKLAGEIRGHERLAAHDQSDYVGLGELADELGALEASVAELETRWLEVSELLEA